MKDFDVTYRAKDGKQAVIRIAAEDRRGVFSELEKHGISAIRVEESKGKSRKPLAINRSRPANRRGFGVLLAILGILAVGVSVFLAFDHQNEPQIKPKIVAKGLITESQHEKASDPVEEPQSTPPSPVETNLFVKRPGALQLPNGKVITFNPPAPGEEKTVWVQGRKYTVDSEGNFSDDSPKHTFDNRFENTMEAMSAVGGGCLPAAALSIKQEDIVKYMATPIVINDDDPDEIVEKKIATAEMKELFRDYLKEGGTWEEFVMELSHIRRTEHLLNSQAIREIATMLREGDEEGAQMYRAKVDEFMKSKGYRGLKVPEAWGLDDIQMAEEPQE